MKRTESLQSIPFPKSFRGRLSLAFVIVAGLTSGLLAIASYVYVREARISRFTDNALRRTEANVMIAGNIRDQSPGRSQILGLIDLFDEGDAFETVVVTNRATFATDGSLHDEVPANLRSRDGISHRAVDIDGARYLVSGGAMPGSTDELYFFFPQENIFDELDHLRTGLIGGWIGVVIIAALVGNLIARQTLRPLGKASRAACAIAQGRLDTRLPVGHDEFGSLAAAFNDMADNLQQKMEALTRARDRERKFTSDVAHELRTPVGALVVESSLLREHMDELPGPVRRPAEFVVKDGNRLRRLVEELLEVSRLEAARETLQTEEVEVGAIVQSVVASRGWRDRVDLDTRSAPTKTDRRRLERIVANLVENAIRHGQRDVRVTSRIDGGEVVIEVSDGGDGIQPQHLPHIFRRFYRGDSARSSESTGLGLAIARENAKLLGGEISVDSSVGRGSRFTVHLPRDGK